MRETKSKDEYLVTRLRLQDTISKRVNFKVGEINSAATPAPVYIFGMRAKQTQRAKGTLCVSCVMNRMEVGTFEWNWRWLGLTGGRLVVPYCRPESGNIFNPNALLRTDETRTYGTLRNDLLIKQHHHFSCSFHKKAAFKKLTAGPQSPVDTSAKTPKSLLFASLNKNTL